MSRAGVCCALVAFKFESDKRASTGTQMVHDDDDDEAVDSSHSVSDLGMRITMSMPIPFPLADPSVRRVTQI